MHLKKNCENLKVIAKFCLCEILGLYNIYLQFGTSEVYLWDIATFYDLLRHPLYRSVLSIKVYKHNLKF